MDTIMAAARDMQCSPAAHATLEALAVRQRSAASGVATAGVATLGLTTSGVATPRAAVEALLDAGLAEDALALVARLLPRRYAVAWLCQCARHEALGETDRAGLALAERWVRDGDDAPRRAALAFAKAQRFGGCGAWAAAAAGWSGGDLAAPGSDKPAPPGPAMTARAVALALTHLAAHVREQFVARRVAFVRSALNLLGTPNGIDGEST